MTVVVIIGGMTVALGGVAAIVAVDRGDHPSGPPPVAIVRADGTGDLPLLRRRRIMTEIHTRRSLITAALITAVASLAAGSTEAPFLAENRAAMNTMMAAMSIEPSGDVDADFVAMMVPHHQGAIDMAQAELRYGRNEQLRRLAQEIIVTQQQEIAAMRLALGQPLSPSGSSSAPPSPTDRSSTEPMSHHSPIPGGRK